jgi:Na+-transporting NADH:ubiquinone oxidoreductase subunit A
VHIRIRRGLDVPIKGKPSGEVQDLPPPKLLALDLDPFQDVRFKLLVKVGDEVLRGQPILYDKQHPKRMFISPAAGKVTEVRRGLKRRLLAVVIERAAEDTCFDHAPLDITSASREELVDKMCATGLFAHIRMRPFNLLANPEQAPRSIFVKAIESAPFVPPAEMQVEKNEKAFAYGLQALKKLTDGPVHLIYKKGSTFKPFVEADAERHTAAGPHPVSNPSLHIQKIDPIRGHDCLIWTLGAHDVVSIGTMLMTGKCHFHRVIGIGGTGIVKEKRGFFRVHWGHALGDLLAGRADRGEMRLISGDPLMGRKGEAQDFLGFDHFAFTVIPENRKRPFLHFLRLGFDKYTASRTYGSGFLPKKQYAFTTSNHGEERAFIDAHVYDRVMPLRLPTAPLVKSVIARDWDQAEALGVLEVAPEDFALPTFVCPSKIEMVEIIKEGLHEFAQEAL